MKTAILMVAIASMVASCGGGKEETTPVEPFILNTSLSEEECKLAKFTPEIMWKMGQMGALAISPNGESVVYQLTHFNLEQNASSSTLWVQPFEGGEATQVTDWGFKDNSPQWSADGQTIYFMSSREGDMQLWSIAINGDNLQKLTSVDGGIGGFGVNAAADRVWYCADVEVETKESKGRYEDMPKSNALVYDDLMVRHWDTWDKGSYSHLFVAEIRDGKVVEAVDIVEGEPWDVPISPFFDTKEISWNNRGDGLAYTARKLTGYEYAVSTNTDIYLYSVADGSTKNLTQGMMGYDKCPVFSPDDSMVAWQSMEGAGNESDKNRLMVMSVDGSNKRVLTDNYEHSAYNHIWNADGKSLYFTSSIAATHQICSVSVGGDDVRIITNGDHDYTSLSNVGEHIAATRTTHSNANEWYSVDPQTGDATQRSFINKDIYDNIEMGRTEKRWVKTTDGKEMLTWVILPPNFDETKSYPTLLYCQGGPQSVVSQFWSTRWNFQLMAARGYIIVAPNRRGLPSFGQEWLDQISGDYSGQNIRDYLSAIDDVAKESWVDNERLGCVGASYGGYSVFYLAGHHQRRFKAFISHCGIFDLTSMYGSTEELWFVNRDFGGAYWETNNNVAQRTYQYSPHSFINKWDTPILIYTGVNDLRVPYTQSLEAFTAARSHGIESRLVVFEDEGHLVTKPQNNIVWNREFFGWLDRYLKGSSSNSN